MAKAPTPRKSTRASAAKVAQRQAIGADATYEIESIVAAMQGLEDTTANWYLMRGLILRIEALNDVAMSVLNGDDGREASDMLAVIYGRNSKEADHA